MGLDNELFILFFSSYIVSTISNPMDGSMPGFPVLLHSMCSNSQRERTRVFSQLGGHSHLGWSVLMELLRVKIGWIKEQKGNGKC